jgi:hypothetical protein
MARNEHPEDFPHLALIDKRRAVCDLARPCSHTRRPTRASTNTRKEWQLGCTSAIIPALLWGDLPVPRRAPSLAPEGFRLPSIGGDSSAVPFPK